MVENRIFENHKKANGKEKVSFSIGMPDEHAEFFRELCIKKSERWQVVSMEDNMPIILNDKKEKAIMKQVALSMDPEPHFTAKLESGKTEYIRLCYTFEGFKDYVHSNIKKHLSKEYEDARVAIEEVEKINQVKLSGLSIVKKGSAIAPCIYLEEYFDAYNNGLFLDSCMKRIAQQREELERITPGYSAEKLNSLRSMNWEEIKDLIYIQAIGVENNKDLLREVPHKKMGDIAAVYRIHLGATNDTVASALIRNQVFRMFPVSLNELHEIAVNNSMKAFPPVFYSFEDVQKKLIGIEDPIEMDLFDNKSPFYVLTNEQMMNGASVMFYPNVFEKAELIFPEGFYIIPSSIHELLIASKQSLSLQEMEEMIQSVNVTEVSDEELLSDKAHEYDSKSRTVILADERARSKENLVIEKNYVI